MKNNKKGFTLVELLAVIVILAIVILIAVTAVIPRMNKAKKKSFEDEAQALIRAAEEKSVAEDDGEGSCYYIVDTTVSSVNYKGLIGSENAEGSYIKKNDGTTYAGVVKKVDGVWTIYIRQTNKDKFYINGKTSAQIAAGSSEIGSSSSAPSGFVASCS